MNAALPLPALDAIRAHEDEMVALRRQIHGNPELAFEEHATADLVAERLQRWGFEVHRGLGKTGVVGTLRAGSSDRRIGLRADMDALPIAETSGKPWASKVFGKMHACGHDGHTAMLLSAARHFAATRNFDGILHLVFQPAEEGLGGARQMLEDGFLELGPCDAMFGMHNMPGKPAGKFVAVPGYAMASADTCIVKVRGVGGHGAIPHKAVDAIVAASSIVMALQTIVSRNVDPLHTAIVSVGAFHSGEAPNVLPQEAELRLTVRAFRPEVRDLLEQRIGEIARAGGGVRRHGRGRLHPPLSGAEQPPGADRVLQAGDPRLAGRRGAGRRCRAGGRQRGLRVLPGEGARLLRVHRQRRGHGRRLHGAQRRLRLQRPRAVHRRQLLGQAGRGLAALMHASKLP